VEVVEEYDQASFDAAWWPCEAQCELLWRLDELAELFALSCEHLEDVDDSERLSDDETNDRLFRRGHRNAEIGNDVAWILAAAYAAAATGDAAALREGTAWAQRVLPITSSAPNDVQRLAERWAAIRDSDVPAFAQLERYWLLGNRSLFPLPERMPVSCLHALSRFGAVRRGLGGKVVRGRACDVVLGEVAAALGAYDEQVQLGMPFAAERFAKRVQPAIAMHFPEASRACEIATADTLAEALSRHLRRAGDDVAAVDPEKLTRELLVAAGVDRALASRLFNYQAKRAKVDRGRDSAATEPGQGRRRP
jgi:hypothetical protein